MAWIRRNSGKKAPTWTVIYRDRNGKQIWKTFKKQGEAKALHAKVHNESSREASDLPTNTTMEQYSEIWLQESTRLRQQSLERYKQILNNHVIPAMGKKKVTSITRTVLRAYLTAKLQEQAKRTVQLHLAILHKMLEDAKIEHSLIDNNPADGLGKPLGLTPKSGKRSRSEIKALTATQLTKFLTTAKEDFPEVYPLFLTLAMAGMRIGEALALTWDDILFDEMAISINKNLDRQGQLGPTKSDSGDRVVEMHPLLGNVLAKLKDEVATAALETGKDPKHLFWDQEVQKYSKQSGAKLPNLANTRMKAILKVADLPSHHTCHSLRHTFASLLLAKGTPIVFVQRQLGHANIKDTVGTYGSWLPMEAPGALNVIADLVMVEK